MSRLRQTQWMRRRYWGLGHPHVKQSGSPPPTGGEFLVDTVPSHSYYSGYVPPYGVRGFGARVRVPARVQGVQRVYVTSLSASGSGTLREALGVSGPKVIIPLRSGAINTDGLYIGSDTWLAGQLAPGKLAIHKTDGSNDNTVLIANGSRNFMIEYLSVRGKEYTGAGTITGARAMLVYNNAHDYVLSHLSLSFGVDAAIDLFNSGSTTDGQATFQNNIVAECLCNAGHVEGCHNRNMLIAERGGSYSLYRNIFMNAGVRAPEFRNRELQYINNIVRNQGYNVQILTDNNSGSPRPHANGINNRGDWDGLGDDRVTFLMRDQGTSGQPQVYLSGNKRYRRGTLVGTDWNGAAGFQNGSEATTRVDTPFDFPTYETIDPAEGLIDDLPFNVGNTRGGRDSLDLRYQGEASRMLASPSNWPDNQADAGGLPSIPQKSITQSEWDSRYSAWKSGKGLAGADDWYIIQESGYAVLEQYAREGHLSGAFDV